MVLVTYGLSNRTQVKMVCHGTNKAGAILRLDESKQNGSVTKHTVCWNSPRSQVGQRKTRQRKSISDKPNNVDKRCSIIQLLARTNGLAEYVDLPKLCVLLQATCGQPVTAFLKT